MWFTRPLCFIRGLCFFPIFVISLVDYVIYSSLWCHWWTMLFTCPSGVIFRLCHLLEVLLVDYVIYSSSWCLGGLCNLLILSVSLNDYVIYSSSWCY